ncbi:DUF4145 domain-containing protein [Mucilaginibacter sp. L3T2-6]|uniref:DUF4145 domain-containing protein n=1 Tax=Mucilaginibacter sp. L3T2-6 TaxID=3062491 RepID=UPI002674A713|nr:DUF4145 domain-containing protein [Mucilaginibacter sp. L3T2-6]MDO3643846.1 DUF4145 domain-containing protein [Mucilaginibacter sp. L3T2-6]MDV6216297.1 DUF4145 domain-containing protein [Mucilaginibacter sp. L3T2-6]
MKCPHCLVEFHATAIIKPLDNDADGPWYIERYLCANPGCLKNILYLKNGSHRYIHGNGTWDLGNVASSRLIYPKSSSRPPVPIEVTDYIAQDYLEACLVMNDSPKASAALSRRCLQNLLLDQAGVSKGDLSKQIQTVIDSGKLPSHLAEDIDAIRNIGNFAAHPNKSISTGEILEVEPHEAEWNLEVLEALFDFFYVVPERARARKAALNAKLSDSGKPPMK